MAHGRPIVPFLDGVSTWQKMIDLRPAVPLSRHPAVPDNGASGTDIATKEVGQTSINKFSFSDAIELFRYPRGISLGTGGGMIMDINTGISMGVRWPEILPGSLFSSV